MNNPAKATRVDLNDPAWSDKLAAGRRELDRSIEHYRRNYSAMVYRPHMTVEEAEAVSAALEQREDMRRAVDEFLGLLGVGWWIDHPEYGRLRRLTSEADHG